MKPIIDDFIENVKAIQGTGKVGAIGFCWGGRYAILAAHDKVDAAFAAHPSLVAVPGDFDPVKKPLSIAIGTKDSLLDLEYVQLQRVRPRVSWLTSMTIQHGWQDPRVHGSQTPEPTIRAEGVRGPGPW